MKILIPSLVLFFSFCQLNAQSSSDYLVRSSTGNSGSSEKVTANNIEYIVQQSIGQQSAIGTFNNEDYIFRQGFIQPDILAKIIDQNLPLNLSVIVAPNPFVDKFSIFFNENIITNVEIQVFDLLGKQLISKSFSAANTIEINLDNLPASTYLLLVKANNRQSVTKMIKR